MTLMQRRRALMGQNGDDSFPLYLYNEGAISPVAGDFTTTGYQYGSSYTQAKAATYLNIKSTSQYNVRGGRTFTTQLTIPQSCVGKTLRVTGTQTNTRSGSSMDMRNSVALVFVSDEVVTTSNTESIFNSGSFVNENHKSQNIAGVSTTININISMVITKIGYVSVVAYKGYNGDLNVKIDKIWIE